MSKAFTHSTGASASKRSQWWPKPGGGPILLLATANPHKLVEFKILLQSLGLTVMACSERIQHFFVEETGLDFATNAILKARSCFQKTQEPSLADDSGLAVDALDGRPGVHSARYGGEGLDDQQRCQLLLKELEGLAHPKRKAQFVCVLAFCFGPREEDLRLFHGETKGFILEETRGKGGFGYDPIFYEPHLQLSFAEMEPMQKNSHSHRAKAIAKFRSAFPKLPSPRWE